VGEWNLIEGKSGYHSGRVKTWEEKRNYLADDDDSVELYHYAKDISQSNNLAKKFPKKVAELQKELKNARERGFTAPRLVGSR
jgi:predicted helicase